MANKTLLFLSLLSAMVVFMSTNGVARELAETSIFTTTSSKLSHLSSRILVEEHCSKSTIEIRQSPTTPLPNGIPQYRVEIINTCVSGCNISNIHVDCGKFSSARLINPTIFKRLKYGDCLVNNGNTFPNGEIISFVYATTYSYSLSVSSLTCN